MIFIPSPAMLAAAAAGILARLGGGSAVVLRDGAGAVLASVPLSDPSGAADSSGLSLQPASALVSAAGVIADGQLLASDGAEMFTGDVGGADSDAVFRIETESGSLQVYPGGIVSFLGGTIGW